MYTFTNFKPVDLKSLDFHVFSMSEYNFLSLDFHVFSMSERIISNLLIFMFSLDMSERIISNPFGFVLNNGRLHLWCSWLLKCRFNFQIYYNLIKLLWNIIHNFNLLIFIYINVQMSTKFTLKHIVPLQEFHFNTNVL